MKMSLTIEEENAKILKFALDLLNETGYGEEITSYSGRNMYGKYCLGVKLSYDKTVTNFFADLLSGMSDDDADSFMDDGLPLIVKLMRMVVTDSLGLGTIVYFPRLRYVEEC